MTRSVAKISLLEYSRLVTLAFNLIFSHYNIPIFGKLNINSMGHFKIQCAVPAPPLATELGGLVINAPQANFSETEALFCIHFRNCNIQNLGHVYEDYDMYENVKVTEFWNFYVNES